MRTWRVSLTAVAAVMAASLVPAPARAREPALPGVTVAAASASHRGIRRWLLRPACLGLVAAVTLVGCGGSAGHQAARPSGVTSAATASATATGVSFGLDSTCLNPAERRDTFVLDGPGHDRLAAVSIGTGRVAVILAHQGAGSLCDWWPYARSLAARFRVVAFDFDGSGGSPPGHGDYPGEVAAAAAWARQHGSRQIILMGASLGGLAVMLAAANLGDSVTGVINLSGAALYPPMDAVAAARRVRVPVLFAYGTQDLGSVADAGRVRAATASADKPVVTSRSPDHGVELVEPPTADPKVRQAVLQFIQAITHG
jgi:pimeloyl-ACP methyl ester carboxylesterase